MPDPVLNVSQSVPGVLRTPMLIQGGLAAPPWYSFFVTLWNRTGGAIGTISAQLDLITDTVGSLLFRGTTEWEGLDPGNQFDALQMGAFLPEWGPLTGNNFGPQAQNSFFAAPSGATGVPTFRPIASSDLAPVAGSFPGVPNDSSAPAGDVGEFISSEVLIGGAVILATGTAADITHIDLTPGDWDIWGNVVTAPAAGTTQTIIKGWLNTVSATDPGLPNQGCYALLQTAIAAALAQALPLGSKRLTVPAGPVQRVFLSAAVTFATSTLSAYGFVGARRRR